MKLMQILPKWTLKSGIRLSKYYAHSWNGEMVIQIGFNQLFSLIYRYCDNRRTKLRDHIVEGFDKKFWEYYED